MIRIITINEWRKHLSEKQMVIKEGLMSEIDILGQQASSREDFESQVKDFLAKHAADPEIANDPNYISQLADTYFPQNEDVGRRDIPTRGLLVEDESLEDVKRVIDTDKMGIDAEYYARETKFGIEIYADDEESLEWIEHALNNGGFGFKRIGNENENGQVFSAEQEEYYKKLEERKKKVIDLYNSGKSQSEIADELGESIDFVVRTTKHLGIDVGKPDKDLDDRIGDDPSSKQYFDRTIKNEGNDDYQKYFDEFMEKWATEYSDGDDCHDAAVEYADSKVLDPTLDVEDFGPNGDEDDDF